MPSMVKRAFPATNEELAAHCISLVDEYHALVNVRCMNFKSPKNPLYPAVVSVFVLAPNTCLLYSKGDMLSPATAYIRA